MEIPEEIDIFVKRIKNTPLQFRVRTQNKIGDLKEIIYKEHGYSIEYQRIIIQGTQYDDNVPLSYICEKGTLKEGNILECHLVVTQPSQYSRIEGGRRVLSGSRFEHSFPRTTDDNFQGNETTNNDDIPPQQPTNIGTEDGQQQSHQPQQQQQQQQQHENPPVNENLNPNLQQQNQNNLRNRIFNFSNALKLLIIIFLLHDSNVMNITTIGTFLFFYSATKPIFEFLERRMAENVNRPLGILGEIETFIIPFFLSLSPSWDPSKYRRRYPSESESTQGGQSAEERPIEEPAEE